MRRRRARHAVRCGRGRIRTYRYSRRGGFIAPAAITARSRAAASLTFGTDGRDPYLRLPLRLQARTRHGVLYAYNAAHLDWIEAFVAAPLRERRIGDGRANRSIASRLPAWVKAAKNREEVLRALAACAAASSLARR